MEGRRKYSNLGFESFAQWAFQALLLGVVSFGVSKVSSIAEKLEQLGIQQAILIQRIDEQDRANALQDKKIDRLDDRVHIVELRPMSDRVRN